MKFKNQRATRPTVSMIFSMSSQSNINNNSYIKPIVTNSENTVTPSDEDKMKWGKPIWFFIHTLCEKVKEDSFNSIKNELIDIFKMICMNLPCPTCSQHATTYLKNMDINKIICKEDLKVIFFHFHNEVNKRKGYQEFPLSSLSQYENANVKNMYLNFMYHFKEQYNSIKLMSENMYRLRVASNIENWLKAHTHDFYTT